MSSHYDFVDAAVTLDDLRVPPGNRLEALDQRRICCIWTDTGPREVESGP